MRTYEALWRKENPNQSKMQIRTTERETTEEEEEEEEEDAEQNARKLERDNNNIDRHKKSERREK
jgi:hypothetical protein